jgi:hypothetical protein
LFVLALLLDWCVYVLLWQVGYWIPESVFTVPVKVAGVKPDLSSLSHHKVHISYCLIQDGIAAEIDIMSSIGPCSDSSMG